MTYNKQELIDLLPNNKIHVYTHLAERKIEGINSLPCILNAFIVSDNPIFINVHPTYSNDDAAAKISEFLKVCNGTNKQDRRFAKISQKRFSRMG